MRPGSPLVFVALVFLGGPALAAFVDHDEDLEPVYADGGERGGGGVGFFDYDGDGDVDFLVTHASDGVRLYANDGPPDFPLRDVTEEAGLPTSATKANGIAVSDFDRDGDLDLALADRISGVSLWVNQGGSFVDETAFAIPGPFFYIPAIAATDVDGDGWTDLFLGGFTDALEGSDDCIRDTVLWNQGDGTFTDAGPAWGIDDVGCALAVMGSDYDEDGDADLLTANDYGPLVVPSRLLRNDGLSPDGGVVLTDVSAASGFDHRLYGMGLTTADVNDDGFADYFSTSISRALLLLGSADGTFTDATDAYGVGSVFAFTAPRATWGAAFLDVEADGALDLAVASGFIPSRFENPSDPIQPNLLFSNLGAAGPAPDVAAASGVDAEDSSRGMAIADFDGDGDDDLATAAIGGLVHLYRNDGDSGPVVEVRLHGTVSSPEGIGAWIGFACTGVRREREMVPSGSYASSHDAEVRLPLAGCPDGGDVEIRWPSGVVERVTVPGTTSRVEETEPEWIEIDPEWLPADGSSASVVRVTPRAPDGSALGAGHAIAVTSSGADVGAVADRGDGSYEAIVTAAEAPGSAALEIAVDGRRVAAHPRIRFFPSGRDRTVLRASQRGYVVGDDLIVTIRPADGSGTPDGPGRTVTFFVSGGTLTSAVADLGDGRYEAHVSGEGGPLGIDARVDGLSRAVLSVPEVPAVDPVLSTVRVIPSAVAREEILKDGIVSIGVSGEDGLGRRLDPTRHVYELFGSKGPVVPLSEERGTQYTANVPADGFEAVGPLEVRVDGVSLALRASLLVYDDPAEVVAAIDPARSRVSPHQETVHADGEDYVWAFVELYDASGGSLPFVEGLALRSDAFALVEEVRHIHDTDVRQRLRAVGDPGEATIDLEYDGVPLGVSRTLTLLEPRVHDVDLLGVRTCVTAERAPADGEAQVYVLLRPHDAEGFLVGSPVPLAVRLDGEDAALDYRRPGTYVADIPPRSEAATVEIESELGDTGRIAHLSVEYAKGFVAAANERCVELEGDVHPPDAGPDGGGEDAGPHEDAGSDPNAWGVRGGGCACGAAPGGVGPWALLALGFIWIRRRTRSKALLLALLFLPRAARAEFVDHDVLDPVAFSSDDSMGAGVAFTDWDSDGDLDLAVTLGPAGVRLYENGGGPDWEMTDVSLATGMPSDVPFAFGIAASDFDRDGDVDLVYADRFEGLRLLENQGGVFEDASAFAATKREWYGSSLAVGDLDGDGWTDVWVAGYTTWYDDFFHDCAHDVVFHNRGDGTFEDVSDAWGVADEGCTLAVVLSDYDRDGDPDVLLGNDFGQFVVPNRLYRNDGIRPDGGVSFRDVSRASGFDRRLYAMGLATADVDGNGRPDYFSTSIGRAVLLLGQDDGTFVDGTEDFGVASAYSIQDWRATWGAALFDADLDGRFELYAAAGYLPAAFEIRIGSTQPSLFYTGLEAGAASQDEANAWGIDAPDITHGAAVGDFDGDGDPDLATAALAGSLHLYRNETGAAPVVELRLHGRVSSPEALGAQATLSCAGVLRWQEMATGGSYASMHAPEMRIPLAGCEAGGMLELRWPSGLVESIAVDGTTQTIERTEPEFLAIEPAWLPADGASEAIVTFTPRAPDGSLLGAGHAVTMTPTVGWMSAARDRGDGTYDAQLRAPPSPGSAALTISLDGVALPAHPRARFFAGDRTIVRASPLEYVAGATDVVATVEPRDATGAKDGPGRTVDIVATNGALVGGVVDQGDGRYRATVHGDGGGPVTISARVDGMARGPSVDAREIFAIDPSVSLVRMTPGAISRDDVDSGGLVTIQVSPRDSIGIPVADASEHVYEVRGASGVHLPIETGKLSAYYTLSFIASEIETEGPLEIRVDGVLLDRRAEFDVYAEPADLADRVDPLRSQIASFHETAHADGEDYAWVVVRLMDGDGDKLPWVDGFTLESDETTFVEDRQDRYGFTYKARMRASGAPGPATFEVAFDGVPIGLSETIELLGPVSRDLDSIAVETCPDDGAREATGLGVVNVFVRPHAADQTLLGSNVPLRLWVDGEPWPLDYGLPGTYLAYVPTADEPVRRFVQTELVGTDRGSTTWIDFYPDGDPPEPRDPCVELEHGFVPIEPAADAGPDAGEDAGGADAAPDAAPNEDGGPTSRPPEPPKNARGGGCACRAAGNAPDRVGWWIGIVLLACRRRP